MRHASETRGVALRGGRRSASRVIASVAILLAFVGVLPLAAAAQPAPEGADAPTATIDQAVADAIAANGTADFWVLFRATADLSGAYGIGDWAARGQYVHEQLQTTATERQAAFAAELTASHVAFESFSIVNAIRVHGGGQATLDSAAARPEVARIMAPVEYALVKPIEEPATRITAIEWGIENIRADEVWETFGVRGAGITVASIDTGTQFDHPALVDQYRGNLGDGSFDHNYNWFDAAGSCPDAPCDLNGHGTHTMGTMVGDDGGDNQIGVAPEANWITANGCCPSDAALIASGEWMLAPTDLDGDNPRPDLRPHIVNNSWGSVVPSDDPFMEEILEAWAAAGIFGMWANGNSGPACRTSGSPGSRIINYSAGAYDINNVIASFSGRGPGQDGEIKPNLAAPGVNVRSSLPGDSYGNFSGTSMASPHTAGAIALMWSAAPALVGDPDTTKGLLDDTAVDVDATECGGDVDDNNVFGEGRLDAFAAVDQSPRGPTGTLAGTVTDATTGDPIAGATVSTEIDGRPRSTTTGDDGTYEFTGLPVGTHDFTAGAFGYASATQSGEIIEDETTTLDFALEPVPSHAVSGTVTDDEGNPVAGATVSIEPTPLEPATTDENGQYSFASVPEGTYTLTIDAGGCFADFSTELVVDGDEVVDAQLARQSDAYGHTCQNEPSSYIEATDPIGLTGDDASVEVDLPFPFPFYGAAYTSVHVATNGFVNFNAPDATFSNSAIPSPATPNNAIYPFWDDLFVDAEAQVLTADLGDRFVIEWRNIRPFANDTDRWDIEAVLHDNGQMVFQYRNIDNDLESGNSATVGIENADGTDALQYSFNEAVLSNDTAIRFLPPPSGFVSGTVTDANDGLPVAGATVTATSGETTRTATTGPDGTYLMILPLGTWTVEFTKTNYVTETGSVEITEDGQEVTLDVELRTAVASVDPAAIETVLLPGWQRTFNVRLGNTGSARLTWEAFERGGGRVDGELQWLPRAVTSADVANVARNSEHEGVPRAARWTPASPAPAQANVLLYADDPYHPSPNTYTDQALQALGLEYTAFYDANFPGFEAALAEGGWDLVLFANDNFAPPVSTFDALNDWVTGGGKLIAHSWQVEPQAGHPLWETLGFSFGVSDFGPPDPVFWWDDIHPLFTDPESVPEFTELTDGRYGIYGQHGDVLDGFEALAGYTEDPADGEVGLVLGNGDRTLFRGFADGHNDADQDGDDVPDGVEFWINSIVGIEQGFFVDVPWLDVIPDTGSIAPGRSQTLQISIDTTGLDPGVYSAAIALATNAGRTPTVTIPISLVVTPYLQGVNAGGDAYTDRSQDPWAADQAFDGSWGYEYAPDTTSTDHGIRGTRDDALYQDARTGRLFTYRFDDLPDGVYEVELHFAEIQRRRPGDRLFDVTADTTPLLIAYDIAEDVGRNAAVVHRFFVEVNDGRLRIRFIERAGFDEPIVNAVQLTHRPDLTG